MNGNNGYAVNPPERCDEAGVAALQRKIREHWKPWGISFVTHEPGFHPAIRFSRFDLRSDMVNGLPRGLYLERMSKKARSR